MSQQARRRSRYHEWVSEVRRVAEEFWTSTDPATSEPIAISITYFFEGSSLDIDNIPKAILDALKALVYIDDSQITDLICRKRDLTAELRITNPSETLAEALASGSEFLLVVVRSSSETWEDTRWKTLS